MQLSAVLELKKELEQERRRLEELKLLSTNITGKIDGLPRVKAQSSKVELAAQIVDSERRISELEVALISQSVTLTEEILKRVTGQAVNVLIMRYVGLKRFEEIALEMKYSKPNIYRFHSRGVKEFERTSDKNSNRRRTDTGGKTAL